MSVNAESGIATFERMVHEAIALLRSLPRAPADSSLARERLRGFAANDAVPCDFVVDLAPGAEHADFDVYLDHPEGGTVALSFRDDGARPWFVDYSHHWAANFVLHVGALNVTIQEAMFALQYLSEERPDLTTPLVRDALIAEAIGSMRGADRARLDVTSEEIQAASEAFRRRHDLHAASDTHAWLGRMGWSMHRFRYVLTAGIELRKMEEVLVGHAVDSHFANNTSDYDVVRYFRVWCDDAGVAATLARDAGCAEGAAGLMAATQAFVAREPTNGAPPTSLRGALETARAYTLGAAIAVLPVAAIVGPIHDGRSHVVTQIIARTRATELDASTRSAARERLVQDWVDERLRKEPVRWNWT